MDTIGSQLKSGRQRKNCSLEDAAKATKIKVDLLSAFESDTFPKETAPVYLKSHLKNYADFLGLEGRILAEQFVQQYGDGAYQSPLIEAKDVATAPSKLRLPLGVACAIFFLSLAVFTRSRWIPWFHRSPALPSGTSVSLPNALQPHDFFATSAFLNEIIPLPSANLQKHILRLQGSEQCYVKVIADEVKVFDGQLLKGQQKEFLAKQFHFILGNASGAAVFYDGILQHAQAPERDHWERDWPPKTGTH